MSKPKSLRSLKVDPGVTRLAAADVRHLLKTSPAKPGKYKSKRVECDGYGFDSQAERDHYLGLRLRYQAGDIFSLELQPRYPLHVSGILVATYVADFRYVDGAGILHVIDVKGVKTAVYRIKRKLMKALYGIDVEEIT